MLGIDVGTASTKGVLVTPEGEVSRAALREHSVSFPAPGWAEQDAEALWWGDFVAVCRELLDGVSSRVAAVGVSGLGPCVVPCDADDRPLRQAILYGIDTRAVPEAAELERRLGADAVLARGGSTLSSQALGPKLLWLSRNEPEAWAQMARWHTAASFLVAKLTGEWVLDHHSASQCDPFYELGKAEWAEDWSTEVPGLPLPRLGWASEVAGPVTAAAAERTGIEVGTPVIVGTIDAWAEAVSVGVRHPGELMLMYGSTMFFILSVDRPVPHPAVWTTAGTDPGTFTRAGGTATAGSLTAWLRDLVGGPSFATLLDEAATVMPGAEGLLMLPYLAGERTPVFDPRARGTLTGLTLRHRRGHIYRAALEGIAFGARHSLEAITPTPPRRTVAVGGGTRGSIWPQIVSDVTGFSQQLPAETLGAAYGDARLAAEGVGLVGPETSWQRGESVILPNPELKGLYDRRYDLFRELYAATAEIQHELADAV